MAVSGAIGESSVPPTVSDKPTCLIYVGDQEYVVRKIIFFVIKFSLPLCGDVLESKASIMMSASRVEMYYILFLTESPIRNGKRTERPD